MIIKSLFKKSIYININVFQVDDKQLERIEEILKNLNNKKLIKKTK